MAALEHLSVVIHSQEGYFWNMTFQMHTFNPNYTKKPYKIRSSTSKFALTNQICEFYVYLIE